MRCRKYYAVPGHLPHASITLQSVWWVLMLLDQLSFTIVYTLLLKFFRCISLLFVVRPFYHLLPHPPVLSWEVSFHSLILYMTVSVRRHLSPINHDTVVLHLHSLSFTILISVSSQGYNIFHFHTWNTHPFTLCPRLYQLPCLKTCHLFVRQFDDEASTVVVVLDNLHSTVRQKHAVPAANLPRRGQVTSRYYNASDGGKERLFADGVASYGPHTAQHNRSI